MNTEIATVEELYDRLQKFIHWVCWRRSSEHILMRRDEIEGELYLEMVKGWLYYKDEGLSSGQLLAVMRKILDNRIGELVHKFYSTHRRDEHNIIDYDSMWAETDSRMSPEDLAEHRDAFTMFLDTLSEDERQVVDLLLHPDFRLAQQMALSSMRKSWVYKNPTVTANPRIISEALHIEYTYAKELWAGIRRKWRIYDDKI